MTPQDRKHSHNHHQIEHHESSLLEMQAADYFKLDPAQVNMLNSDINKFTKPLICSSNGTTSRKDGKFFQSKPVISPTTINTKQQQHQQVKQSTSYVLNVPNSNTNLMKRKNSSPIESKEKSVGKTIVHQQQRSVSGVASNNDDHSVLASSATYLVGSSTTSTNSLPSISSSPSVSPSLLCPHLTLNDILLKQKDTSKSPNTIGLCPKCRLDPPPNIQSPLSPLFDPMQNLRRQSTFNVNNSPNNIEKMNRRTSNPPPIIKRGYSDHQIVSYSKGSSRPVSKSEQKKLQLIKIRQDDSLDYYLEPNELKRLQLSPTLRNSVEFIRKNSTEAARVLKIYKNGHPYDKPLRICIMRGEFATLNHLLDHINSRQLIPSGARYLFHLDGSLVYSVNELKHGHVYVVSGTRTFDYKANTLLREQNVKESEKSFKNSQSEFTTNLVEHNHQFYIPINNNNNNNQKQELSMKQSKFTNTKEEVRRNTPKEFKSSPMRIRSKSNLDSDTIYSSRTSLAGKSAEIDNSPGKKKNKTLPQESPSNYYHHNENNNSKNHYNRENKYRRITSPQKDRKILNQDIQDKVEQATGSKRKQISKKKFNKFVSQNDLSTTTTEENDYYYYDSIQKEEKPIEFVRAKSELSAIPTKRKKNVTFVEFKDNNYENSSPNVRVSKTMIERPSKQDNIEARKTIFKTRNDDIYDSTTTNSSLRGLETNEIGIQVSESIDGYLIDLPLPMPPKGEEKKSFLRKGGGSRASYLAGIRSSNKRTPESSHRVMNQRGKSVIKNKQIVTITERQLSTNEMEELKDLDHGDHHFEREECHKAVGTQDEISLSNYEDAERKSSISSSLNKFDDVTICINDPNETITIGQPDKPSKNKTLKDQTNKQKNTNNNIMKLKEDRISENKTNWKYPSGTSTNSRVSSATPTERPVSQSDANDVVHARVTTPTPSLSTAGETNSLTMSYEMSNLSSIDRQNVIESTLLKNDSNIKLPARDFVPVVGRLISGTNPSSKNFRLIWVNGFAINDRYPENSTNILQTKNTAQQSNNENLSPTSTTIDRSNSNSSKNKSLDNSLLSPTGNTNRRNQIQFKPSERFHNWVCHSKKYYELIYPAGSLIVLWCRITNEQRFYSNHTSSISCLTLASLDVDLVASSQIEDIKEGINASIHLWSLKTLETLKIIDQDLFCNQLIFSLRVKNSSSEGCELCISTRDDKRLWLYVIYSKLETKTNKNNDRLVEEEQELKSLKRRESLNNRIVIKVNKLLQSNQLPLLVSKMSNAKRDFEQRKSSISSINKEQHENEKNTTKKENNSPYKQSTKQQTITLDDNEVIVSFGRRHFQLWIADKKQTKLMLMKLDNKNQNFIDSMLKANCMVRLSPKEFLVGDMDGHINLININYKPLSKSLVASSIESQKYTIETIKLLNQSNMKIKSSSENNNQKVPNTKQSFDMTNKLPSVTCISRITGSLFVSSDSNCVIKFWKIQRTKSTIVESNTTTQENGFKKKTIEQTNCHQLSSINLPQDLGFICTIIVSNFNRKQSIVEMYIISTSNVILFGSIQLPPQSTISSIFAQKSSNKKKTTNSEDIKEQMLANSYLFVVYEGHETSVMNLVADIPKASELLMMKKQSSSNNNNSIVDFDNYYFTCSIDCKICKWNGKSLIWKSMLPSACSSLAVHPIGSVLAVGSGDGTVYILDKTSGLLISYFPLTPVCINCLAYSIDGTLLAAGCANGSIFVLPVYDRGLKYKKVSIFQSPYSVVSLQFSTNNQYILTSVTHGSYQELILWDLPNFRYMRDNVKMTADRIEWFDSICSGSEDVRAIWENANLTISNNMLNNEQTNKSPVRKSSTSSRLMDLKSPTKRITHDNRRNFIVNLSCHRLIRSKIIRNSEENEEGAIQSSGRENLVIASDTRGYLRLFRYPCYDIDQAFFEIKISSSPVNCCRFLAYKPNSSQEPMFVSSAIDGSICIWTLN